MGLRVRKSINLGGGFRVNISKSGIGYSWGVPGYRITKTAQGKTRTSYSIPGTGISYVSESSSSGGNSAPKVQASAMPTENTVDLDIGDIHDYQTVEYSDFIKAIKKCNKLNKLSNMLLFTVLLLGIPIFAITVIMGIILKIHVRKNLTVPVEYEFDAESKSQYDSMKQKWVSLNSSKKLWQILTSSTVTNKKIAAGASNLITRKKMTISQKKPSFFKTSETFICLLLKKETIYLLPDKALIIKGSNIGAVDYNTLHITGEEYNFIEDEVVPKDAVVIRKTWLKVNKDGSPDKRFKGNRQIPVCKYGLIKLTTSSGMDIRICCSNHKLVEQFN